MKILVTLKDPDGFSDAIDDAVKQSLADQEGLDDDEREALFEARQERFGSMLGQWVEYGEYVTLEFDTEAGTATVRRNEP